MSAIPFIFNRQIGAKSRSGLVNYYPTLNLDSVLSKLSCHKLDIFTVRGEESEVPPFACQFRKDAHSDLLAVANEDGDIAIYDTSRPSPDNLRKSFNAHHNAIFDICWVPDKDYLFSGSGDHNATLWDISCCKLISVFKKHSASIKSVDVCCEQSAIFATGSRDGSINIWDSREKNSNIHEKPAISICQAHSRRNPVYSGKKSTQKDPISSVSAVAFQNSNILASAGVADGVLKIWDLRRTYIPNSKYLPSPKYRMNYSDSENSGHGCTSLVFDSLYRTLYACCTNHKILKFDCHSYTKLADTYNGFRCTTYFVKMALSSDDQYLLCGSSDDKAYVWKTAKPGLPTWQLAVHSAEVTSVAWSPQDITKLATCGDDNKVAVWKVAETETVSVNSEIFGVAEPYTESPKNESPPLQNSFPRSITASSVPTKKSPLQSSQTSVKPAVTRVITSFFSPVTPSSIQPSSSGIQDLVPVNSSDSSNTQSIKCSTADLSPQVLTPSKHDNTSNIMHHSPGDNSEMLSSPELKGSSLEKNGCETSFLSSSSVVQNKENTAESISPETVYKTNSTGQTKRKVTPRHSTPNTKRKQTESSKKTKRLSDKKTPPGKTIMNYFSAVLARDP